MTYKLPFALLIVTVASSSSVWPEPKDKPQSPEKNAPVTQKAEQVPTPQEIDTVLTANVHEILEQSEQLTLFSLAGYDEATESTFHQYKILGQTSVSAPRKSELLASFYAGLQAKGGMKCFSPRHGLRAEHNGKTVDLLICFKCRRFHAYLNPKDGNIAGFAKLLSKTPQAKFDQILKEANIPLPPSE